MTDTFCEFALVADECRINAVDITFENDVIMQPDKGRLFFLVEFIGPRERRMVCLLTFLSFYDQLDEFIAIGFYGFG